jgi:threonine synthase
MYYSSRDNTLKVSSSKALLEGLSKDGGLFLIDHIPSFVLSEGDLNLNYKDLSVKILSYYFDDFSKEEIIECVNSAYNENNFKEGIVKVKSFKDHSFLELFLGPTLAFKDLALTLLPFLLEKAMKHENVSKLKIVTATSGDTGSAALSAFSSAKNIEIKVLYPHQGISRIQEKQMLYFTSSSSRAYALENGNFDDCQKEAKKVLNFKINDTFLSSANSINIGRLIPQVIYYYYAYILLVNNGTIKLGEEIDVIVPTGNFGNIFALYLSKKMGLPINKLVCASNKNKVLDDFFKTGIYDSKREFYITNSPSMDILISSNLERLLSLVSSEEEVKSCMQDLKEKGRFEISKATKDKLKDFISFNSSEEETLKAMKKSFEEDNYLIDPHTGVGYSSFLKYQHHRHVLIASTASFYKFPLTVKKALNLKEDDEFKLIHEINKITNVPIPEILTKVLNDKTPKYLINEKEFEKQLLNDVKYEVSTPATSANLGPGFDIVGIAYNLFNTYKFEKAEKDELIGFDKRFNNENNLVLSAYRKAFEKANKRYQPVKITLLNQEIPESRGLGSSSSCIVAGVLGANCLLNNIFDQDTLLEIMVEEEGHPDNVAPCFLGNFVSTLKNNEGHYLVFRSEVSKELKFILYIPSYEIATSSARKVLPSSYLLSDVIHNASRLMLLPEALKNGNIDLLAEIMDDKIHEPYRLPLIPAGQEIKDIAKRYHLPCSISGAGSSILIISKNTEIIEKIKELKLPVDYEFKVLEINSKGSIIKEVI